MPGYPVANPGERIHHRAMVNISFEIDGRRATPDSLSGAERRTLERVVKEMDDLEMNINGPDFLLDRLRE